MGDRSGAQEVFDISKIAFNGDNFLYNKKKSVSELLFRCRFFLILSYYFLQKKMTGKLYAQYIAF